MRLIPFGFCLRWNYFVPLLGAGKAMTTDQHSPDRGGGSGASNAISAQVDIERRLHDDGIFVSAVQLTRLPLLVTDSTISGNPIIFANDAFLFFFGYAKEEIVGRNEYFLSADTASRETVAAFRRALVDGREETFDISLRHKDNTESTTSLMVMPLTDLEGTIIHHLLSFVDRSELVASTKVVEALMIENARLVKALAERDLLVAETNHRVKNNLMQASMILKLEEQRLRQPAFAEAFLATRTRLDAMAGIHNMLTVIWDGNVIDLAAYLGMLAPQLVPAAAGVTMETRIATGVLVASEVAQCLVLITIELVTNAVKHAFPRRRAGSIRVGLIQTVDAIKLTVSDNGVGMVDGVPESLGYQVVRGLADQLKGSLTVVSDARGTVIEVTVSEELRNRRSSSAPAH